MCGSFLFIAYGYKDYFYENYFSPNDLIQLLPQFRIRGTIGWCHGFKLHLAYNDRGEIIAFVLTGANVSDKVGGRVTVKREKLIYI